MIIEANEMQDDLMDCYADIELKISDFGPDCTVYINDEHVACVGDHLVNGVCEPIYKEMAFTSKNESTKIVISIYRFWKGEERLVYTREANLFKGFNTLFVSYSGVKTDRQRRSIFGRKSVPSDDSKPIA